MLGVNGWSPQKRVADSTWNGQHLADEDGEIDVTGKRRINSSFTIVQETIIIRKLADGMKPYEIHDSFVAERWENMTLAERAVSNGKEVWAKILGFGLTAVQEFVHRRRRANGNGYNITTLADLQVVN